MGLCRLCHEKAGFLRSEHKACVEKQKSADPLLRDLFFKHKQDPRPILAEAQKIADESFITNLQSYKTDLFSSMVHEALETDGLTEAEETKLDNLLGYLGLTPEDCKEALMKKGKGVVIREILAGRLPQQSGVHFTTPVILGKDEQIIWAWSGVAFYEMREYKSFEGGSQGVSLRIAKGVYYRIGSFKGHPVVTTRQTHVGEGALIFTNKHLFWAGDGTTKSLKIAWKKLISVQGYSDGIGLQAEGARIKPMTFSLGSDDGWFAKNLAENIPRLADQ
jgi:hypothetical protein